MKRSHNYRVTDDDNDDNEEEEEENQDEELKQLIQDDEAVIYVKLQIARYYLKLHQLNKAEDILIDVAPKFESLNNNLNSKINSAYYLEKTEHAKILNNYNDYYSNGLLYLSSVTNLTDEEKINYVMNYVLLLYWVIKFIILVN